MQGEVSAALLRQQRQQQEQQQRIESFQSITGCCSAATACNFLSRYNFNLPVALDAFFSLSQREQRILVQQQQQQQQRSVGRGGSHVAAPTAATSSAALSAASDAPVSYGAVAAIPPAAGSASRRGEGGGGAAAVSSSAVAAAERGEAAALPLRHPPEISRTASPAAWASAGCSSSRDGGSTFSRVQQSSPAPPQHAAFSSLPSHECTHHVRRGFAGCRSSRSGDEEVERAAAGAAGSRRQQRGGGGGGAEAARGKQPLQRVAETFSLYAQKESGTAAVEGGGERPGAMGCGEAAGGAAGPARGGGAAAGRGRKGGRSDVEQSEAEAAAAAIEVEGLERLSADIAVGLDDVFFLIFAYYCECQVQGRITREEFFRGMGRLGACTAADLRQLAPQLRQQLQQDKALARCVYAYAFTYSLETCQKVLPLDLCEAYWELLLQPCEYALMRYWLRFIREEHSKKAAYFSRDSWLMVFDFMQQQQQQQDTGTLQLAQAEQQPQTARVEQQQQRQGRQPGGCMPQQQEGPHQANSQLLQEEGKNQQGGEEESLQPQHSEEDAGWTAAALMVEDYDEEGAWPLVIDEFVEWVRRKAKQEPQRQQGQKQQGTSLP